ncbi:MULTISPECIES: MaoC family dehydratase [unclassified Pseudomonas]|uniref:MaoC family dehydratase n=1 Tax=unclassified Pseudomonas TaxID=196821 RepID=UPI0021BB1227|nr:MULTISPECIES: MaoC family dehydratase [unclassified Pseudomonas]MCT8165666.1 MaoC family dehydratase [Pseudomonas sp. HD6422]MCT8184742.1 MaoC family dehydratase [Pseudomonas sp. HD6421]
MSVGNAIYLDDLHVDQTFSSGDFPLDAQQIIDFARQFDPQPFHLDDAAARGTFFKGLAASGWHTAAITMRLLTECLPIGSGVIGAGGDIQWPRPTRPDDVLHVFCKILEIQPSKSKPDRAMVTTECLTLNQHDEVCQRMVSKLLVMRRPSEPGTPA